MSIVMLSLNFHERLYKTARRGMLGAVSGNEIKRFGANAIARKFREEFLDSCKEEAYKQEWLGYPSYRQAVHGCGRANLIDSIRARALDWAIADLEQEEEEE